MTLVYRPEELKWKGEMKYGSIYEKKFYVDPFVALIMSWKWSQTGMKDITFKKADGTIKELRKFKKISIEMKWDIPGWGHPDVFRPPPGWSSPKSGSDSQC